jgi:hypothetical protein
MVLVGRLVVTPQPGDRVVEFPGEASYGAIPAGVAGVNGLVAPG